MSIKRIWSKFSFLKDTYSVNFPSKKYCYCRIKVQKCQNTYIGIKD